MGENSLLNQARLRVAKFIAPRVSQQQAQREIWPYGDGSYSGYRLYLSRKMPELRLDPYGLALAAETSVWANACVRLCSSSVSRMRWELIDAAGNVLEDSPFHRMMKFARLEYQQNLFYLWVQSLCVHGETYMEKLSNSLIPGFSTPGGLRILNAIAIDPQVQNGAIQYYQYMANGGKYRLEVNELFVHRYTSLTDDYRASAPMITAMDAVGIKRSSQAFMRGWYDNFAQPGGIVSPKEGVSNSDSWVRRVMETWTQGTKGADNFGSTIFMPDPVVFTQYDTKMPEHQQELSDDQIQEICAAFRVPVDMVKPGGNKDPLGGGGKMDSSRAMFYEDFTEPTCEDIQTFINDVVLQWLMPNSGVEFAFDFDEIRSLINDTKERSDKVLGEYNSGAITFNEMRIALDYEPVNGGDVFAFKPGMVLISKDNFGAAPALLAPPPPPPQLPPAPTTSALPAPTENKDLTPQLPTTVPPTGKSAALMLNLGNHPDLIRLQGMTRGYVGDTPVKWNEPSSFHVTLASMPVVTDEQVKALQTALDDVDVPDMPLKVGSLGTFDNLDSHAVHFKVRKSGDLLDLQETLHDLINGLGIPMSSFSAPEAYKPHITMGYADSKPPARTFDSHLTVKPTALHLGVGDEVVYQKPIGDVVTPEPPPEDKKPVEPPAKKSEDTEVRVKNVEVSFLQGMIDHHEDALLMSNNLLAQLTEGEGHPELRALAQGIIKNQTAEIAKMQAWLLEWYGIDYTPKEMPPVKSYTESALDELAQWEKKVKNKGVKAAFVNYLIRDEIAQVLRNNLTVASDVEGIKYAFQVTRDTIGLKAITATQSAFEVEFNDLLAKALNSEADRRTWAASLRYLLNKYSKLAFADGLTDGGVDPSEMDSEDGDTLAAHLADQSQYVTGLGDAIYKHDSVNDALASQKSIMWWNKSVYPAYQAALLSADKNSLYEWQYGDSEHCDSCLKMNSQRHRLKAYHSKGIIPKSDSLDCKGFNCACSLVKVSGKARGNWLGG